jgi:hypothetical protein
MKSLLLHRLLMLALLAMPEMLAWSPAVKPRGRAPTYRRTSQDENPVASIGLEGLGDDHEKVGAELASSVQRWLDAEWMPQEIHARMGASCAASYVTCRRGGADDCVMSILTQTADDLTTDWAKYDAEAFVNAWDVANYVSDYLTQKSGNEGCECSSTIY